jgi:hypothetical protein
MLVLSCLLCLTGLPAAAQEEEVPTRKRIARDAESLTDFVSSPVARRFLAAVDALPDPGAERVVFYDRENRRAVTAHTAEQMEESELEGYEEKTLGEFFYYYTRYGTPLAFVRPLDLIGRAGLDRLDRTRLIDFGFGSIGQLRLMASLGADVAGIDVDPLLEALYTDPTDTGKIPRATVAGKGDPGRLRLFFGHFPGDGEIVERLGRGYDVFVSKNTLKRGYIHPEQEVDPRRLVHLGVDDETFVRAVRERLTPGGYFMIYNLCPAQSPDPADYKTWADGRSPFDRALLERLGFEVLAFDRDDSGPAREMARRLGWAEQMDIEQDLFATYTLVRKRR